MKSSQVLENTSEDFEKISQVSAQSSELFGRSSQVFQQTSEIFKKSSEVFSQTRVISVITLRQTQQSQAMERRRYKNFHKLYKALLPTKP